jgi:hypothetical protein
MRKADDQPSVNVPSRADPIVHYTINSTVNGHQERDEELGYSPSWVPGCRPEQARQGDLGDEGQRQSYPVFRVASPINPI